MDERWLIRKRSSGKARVALVFPNSYFVGMSNLGLHAVLRLLSTEHAIACERAFINGESLSKPVRTIETDSPLSSFNAVAFSVPFEGDYPNVVRALMHSGITLRAVERKPLEPIIIGGGIALSINPEPVADAFDAIVMGEAETVIGELSTAIEALAHEREREKIWERLSSIDGVYVPTLMDKPPELVFADTRKIEPAHSVILTSETEFANTFLVEIARGCKFKCHYCAYGNLYCRARFFTADQVINTVRRYKGKFNSVGLISAVVSSHPEAEKIAWAIANDGFRVSVSSLRADTLTEGLVAALSKSGSTSITIAPETGTEKLRRAIGKHISDEDIERAIELAEKHHMRSVKLYFMFGLPSETDEDVVAIGELVKSLAKRRKGMSFTVSACAFVPKKGTPLERFGMAPTQILERRSKLLLSSLKGAERVRISIESIRMSQLQALFSLGDRRMLSVIEKAIGLGGSFSAWKRAVVETLGCTIDDFGRYPKTAQTVRR